MKLLLLFAMSVFASTCFATETVAVSGSALKSSAMKISDLDSEVSDIKLRVTSGAKSKFSSSMNFNYAGASLEKPGGDKRPNVGNDPNPYPVNLTGDLGLRYRLNKNESLYVAAGFYRARPVHSREGEQLEVYTPHLGYNDTFAVDDLQLSSGFRLYISTTKQDRAYGQVGTLGYSLSTMNSIGQSRFSAGVSLRPFASAFDKSDEELLSRQYNYVIGLSPSLQYNKSGRVNAYTALNVLNYNHRRSDPDFTFRVSPITQTLGIGIAVLRDFYLAPYLSFEPERISSDKTTVNLSASINL